jgi:hypothetical protein
MRAAGRRHPVDHRVNLHHLARRQPRDVQHVHRLLDHLPTGLVAP